MKQFRIDFKDKNRNPITVPSKWEYQSIHMLATEKTTMLSVLAVFVLKTSDPQVLLQNSMIICEGCK